MFGSIAMYVANRAAGGAVGSVARWAPWGAVASVFSVICLAFASVAAYAVLEPGFGSAIAAGMIAAAALVLAGACILVPTALDAMERRRAARLVAEEGPVAATVEAVNKETGAAVDYFGPLQVVSAAFLVGLRAGRSVRRPA
jgi:hypothetical protein